MSLDIRLPIGLMFAVMGVLLVVFGITSDKAIYERSLGININLWWGLLLFAFGAVMFTLGRRGTSAARPADETAEGRGIEEREAQIEREGRKERGGR
jgi:protein-S-isoprenylcysteine O-methyltransferase Ste14